MQIVAERLVLIGAEPLVRSCVPSSEVISYYELLIAGRC